jgi:hypothetical protein
MVQRHPLANDGPASIASLCFQPRLSDSSAYLNYRFRGAGIRFARGKLRDLVLENDRFLEDRRQASPDSRDEGLPFLKKHSRNDFL